MSEQHATIPLQRPIAEEYARQWERGAPPPDVFAFIDSRPALSDADITSILLVDIQHRAALEAEPLVARYFSRFPRLAGDERAAGTLAVAEHRRRVACGGSLDPDRGLSGVAEPVRSRVRRALRRLGDGGGEAHGPPEIVVRPNRAPALPAMSATSARADRPVASPEPVAVPERIGRYRVDRLIGEGGFGRVYLGRDTQLRRIIAIKVFREADFSAHRNVEMYLAEGRALAQLDHPHLVPIYDVGRTEGGLCYLVSKFVEGRNLAELIATDRPPPAVSADIVRKLAEALACAHGRRLVHRDIKPQNILIDPEGRPYLIDFGLALRDEDFGDGPKTAGTIGYMSPEQARGEGHLVDGRSDIFCLGIVLYELLTGVRPFQAAQRRELIERFREGSRPPRRVDPAVPAELERICLRALALRAADRYQSADELADDLRAFAAGRRVGEQGREAERARIVPKGLASFDAGDAEFFLRLLPGPVDREGLPQSIRFWRRRIETREAGSAFRVGVMYGPSGCGKSSLVRAGLLPRLGRDVAAIYMDAGQVALEDQILAHLRRRCPELSGAADLPRAMVAIRRGGASPENRKVLIVLDSFEQWLHAHPHAADEPLTRALRQCDGVHLQCLLVIREDFWLAVSRFMAAVEVDLLQGRNTAMVDLFDADHARGVLTAFGRAHGRLPEKPRDWIRDHHRFLDKAIEGLAEDGMVAPARIALFVEVFRNRSWTPAELRRMGGAEGAGIAFLDELFGEDSTNPRCRMHRRAAHRVLAALMPDEASGVRGRVCGHERLLAASGYQRRPERFEDLLRLLNSELRMLTPVEQPPPPEAPEAAQGVAQGGIPQAGAEDEARGGRCYRLAHDHLAPVLRDWLTRQQRQSRRGRAEIVLRERAALWRSRPHRRQLPSLTEWLRIGALTRHGRWTPVQRRMMAAARRYHVTRGCIVMAAVVCLAAVTLVGYGRLKSRMLYEQLLAAEIAEVPRIVRQIGPYRERIDGRLRAIIATPDDESPEKLRAALALLPVDTDHLGYLQQRLIDASPAEHTVIRGALAPYRQRVAPVLWRMLDGGGLAADERFRAACALAVMDPANRRWSRIGADAADCLLRENPLYVRQWIEALRPVAGHLLPRLKQVFTDAGERERRYVATVVLAELLEDDPARLAELIPIADPAQLRVLGTRLGSSEGWPRQRLARLVRRGPPDDATEQQKDESATRRANAAIALLHGGEAERVWPLLGRAADLRLRTYILHRLAPSGVDPALLIGHLDSEPDASVRQALLLGLGLYEADLLPTSRREALIPRLVSVYWEDADPGVHSAARWLLRQWGHAERIAGLDASLASRHEPRAPAERGWLVNSVGQTMAIVPAGGDADPIPRSYAIAMTEVTVEQFLAARPGFEYDRQISPSPDCPINSLSMQDAVYYCRWLSEREGVPEDQMCYPPLEEIERGNYEPYPDYLERTGYRLPTEAEWERAARDGTVTPRHYGHDPELLGRYEWYLENSGERTHTAGTLMPNPLGLFDMDGNVSEYCGFHISGGPGGDWIILRGGHCNSPARYVLPATREKILVFRYPSAGLRLARTIGASH